MFLEMFCLVSMILAIDCILYVEHFFSKLYSTIQDNAFDVTRMGGKQNSSQDNRESFLNLFSYCPNSLLNGSCLPPFSMPWTSLHCYCSVIGAVP